VKNGGKFNAFRRSAFEEAIFNYRPTIDDF
jgi:hypothetical protein